MLYIRGEIEIHHIKTLDHLSKSRAFSFALYLLMRAQMYSTKVKYATDITLERIVNT
jgi:hypothetical protein